MTPDIDKLRARCKEDLPIRPKDGLALLDELEQARGEVERLQLRSEKAQRRLVAFKGVAFENEGILEDLQAENTRLREALLSCVSAMRTVNWCHSKAGCLCEYHVALDVITPTEPGEVV